MPTPRAPASRRDRSPRPGRAVRSTGTPPMRAAARRRGWAVISDEVFGDFPWHDAPDGAARGPVRDGAGLPSLLGEREALTFVLSGLSKVCGLPQMKAAWIVVGGPRAARASALERLE